MIRPESQALLLAPLVPDVTSTTPFLTLCFGQLYQNSLPQGRKLASNIILSAAVGLCPGIVVSSCVPMLTHTCISSYYSRALTI